jgi:allophanate hydrolase subunit 2
VLTIVHAAGPASIQDLGRHGAMHEGVPPGGALVPELLVLANRSAGNRDDAAAIETFGNLVVRADAAIVIATSTDRAATVLAPGDDHRIECYPRRVAYFAVHGGVDAPIILGGRGALVHADIGRWLRAGDHVASANAPTGVERPASAGAYSGREVQEHPGTLVPRYSGTEVPRYQGTEVPRYQDNELVHVIPGPDLDAFADDALAVLASAPYRVLAASDRVGTRLDGPPLPRRAEYVERSRPMVRGAIEVPRDGRPIVLGPDHPTTGGYPILGVIAYADLGRFFAIRPHAVVRFGAR